ncbi:unnamed protein product [Rotaria socialis]|uniref:RBR-type E3 ubiquitin transferase n=1 Tax=Rotaria socialis TaxID=392032 RepID=A0A817Y281_9BILA|nr:unnamed protein product [Rotaria socialis]
MRYSTRNLFRFVRKIILCPLIYQLNNLFFNKDFWPSCVQWNEQLQDHLHLSFSKKIFIFILNRLKIELKSVHLNIIHFIFSLQWLTSLFIIIFYIFQFGINTDDDHLFCMKHIPMFLKAHAFNVFLCTSIFCIIHYDISQNRNILDQYGIEHVCIPTKLISNSKKLCVVCYDEKHFNEFCFSTIKSDCQHLNRTICNSCLFHHVEQACQITFTDDVYCPELGCDVKFDYNTVRAILYFNRDKKLVERYDRFVLHRQLEQMDEFIWCSNKLCNIGQLNEGGILNNIVTCFQCQQKTCFRHRVEWHQGLSCEEYDQFMDFDYECSRRWIVEHSKKCPNCPYQIEKNDGCDHMTCIKCRHEFCWACLADFQPIRRHGNHRHDRTCRHYVPNED